MSHGYRSLVALQNGALPPGLFTWPRDWENDVLQNLYSEIDLIQSREPNSPDSVSFPSSDNDSQAQVNDIPTRSNGSDCCSDSSD